MRFSSAFVIQPLNSHFLKMTNFYSPPDMITSLLMANEKISE